MVTIGRIWVAADTGLRAVMHFNSSSWTNATRLELELFEPDGHRLAVKDFTKATPSGAELTAQSTSRGWHTFRLQAFETPASEPRQAYRLTITYHAPTGGPLLP